MPKKCDAYDNTCAGYEGHEGNHGTALAFQLRGLPYFEKAWCVQAGKEGSESGEQQPGGEKAPDASAAPLPQECDCDSRDKYACWKRGHDGVVQGRCICTCHLTLPQEGDRLDTMDAVRWAREFMRLFGQRLHEVDESLMVGWFANAIMRGWDEARWKAKREQEGEKAPVNEHLLSRLPDETICEHDMYRGCPWCHERRVARVAVPDPEKERLAKIMDDEAQYWSHDTSENAKRQMEKARAIAALLREPRYTHSDDCPMSGWPCMCAGKRASGESLPPKENV